MRDYLYLWHEPEKKRLIASGIEFRDVVPELLTAGGIVLLRHNFTEATFDARSHFEFVPSNGVTRIAADDIYGYGDFCWADFGRGVALAALNDEAIAELTFFAHIGRPLRDVMIPGLANRFLLWTHDDGWYAHVFYNDWRSVEGLLRRLLRRLVRAEETLLTLDSLRRSAIAFWCRRDSVHECEQSEDINSLQEKHRTHR
jgi:hypothetical protein